MKDENKKNRKNKRNQAAVLFLVLGLLACSACGVSRRDKSAVKPDGAQKLAGKEDAQSTADLAAAQEDTAQEAAEESRQQDIYVIIKNDTINSQITLAGLSDGLQICYEYTEGTEFFDKYGNYTLKEDFSEGKLAAVQRLNSNDTLGAIAFTEDTWAYEDVRNYYVEPQKKRFTIADTSYQYDDSLRVFSDGKETGLQEVGDSDVLNVYGIGRSIYSIVVQTGHGTLALTNTELFEGGWLNLGTRVYTKITKDMTMDIPEGVYEFAVANDGYGDSGEILIRRGRTTTIDLNDYKGEGPKMCRLTFDVGVKGAVLTIDGKKVKYSKPMDLRYGVYQLGVYAEGYDAWEKQLVINSPTANIDILLSEDAGSSEADAASDSSSKDSGNKSSSSGSGNVSSSGSGYAGSRAGTLAGSRSGVSSSGSGNTGSSGSSSAGALADTALSSSLASIITGGKSTDYLETLSDLIDSLDKLNRSASSSD